MKIISLPAIISFLSISLVTIIPWFKLNACMSRRYFSGLPPVVSRFQVTDYELFIHDANIVSKVDITIAVYVCITKVKGRIFSSERPDEKNIKNGCNSILWLKFSFTPYIHIPNSVSFVTQIRADTSPRTL